MVRPSPSTRPFGPLGAPAIVVLLALAACVPRPAPVETGPPADPVAARATAQMTAQDVRIGERYLGYAIQAAGGEWNLDPALPAYVDAVGGKLAAASDHPDLPYRFVVLDQADPDTWPLPGGKVAVSRGLLARLSDGAELAAVLAHGIVHASATGEGGPMEREIRRRLGTSGLAVPLSREGHTGPIRDVAVGPGRVGIVMPQRRYDAETETRTDRAAMELMARAGYDPAAYVALLAKEVAWAKDDPVAWAAIDDAHAPSPERVESARAVLAGLSTGGTTDPEGYAAAARPLKEAGPAYHLLAEGKAALADGDTDAALQTAQAGRALEPREAGFLLLDARARMQEHQWTEARDALDRAVALDPGYYRPWQLRGVVRKALEDAAGARADLEKGLEMFPTVAGHLNLGTLELAAGETESGLYHLRQAARGGGTDAHKAAETLTRAEIGTVPGRYLVAGAGLRDDGRVYLVFQNRSPLDLVQVAVEVTVTDPATGAPRSETFAYPGPFPAGTREERDTSLGPFAPEAAASVRVRVTRAGLADPGKPAETEGEEPGP